MAKKYFEILCIDSKEQTVITSTDNLLNRLMGNGVIWKKAELKNNHINDAGLNIKLTSKIIEHNPDTAKISILIKVEGDENLEAFRHPLVKHLKDEKFDFVYILTDDVSKEISENIYPQLNSLENLLRKYLTTFFATRLGPKWWDDIANDELNKKVRDRKNNETLFSKHVINGKEETLVDTKSFLIDFRDLGEIIYRVSAGNLKSDDITKQIEKLDENDKEGLTKAVINLKNEIKTNIKKHFPDFETIEFQKKWEFLYYIRNKVAHNGLLSKQDNETANSYLKELTEFLKKQNDDLGQLQFDPEEIAVYQENIVKQSSRYAKIKKEDLAWELYKMDDWARRNKRPFIGLKYFVADILGIKGYDIGASYDVINELKTEGYLEIYNYSDPTGEHTGQPPAIKIVKPLNELYDER
jgi:hypothetical protein